MSELSLARTNEELTRWSEIVKEPLWYLQIAPIIKDWYRQFPNLSDQEREAVKDKLYGFFVDGMEKNKIFFGRDEENLDQFRQPIDTVVIHHTSQFPGVSWQRLSAMGLVRQYVIPFYDLTSYKGIVTQGRPIWSNHYRDQQQVFYAYHWLIRTNGICERLLDDQNVGFHAGGRANLNSVAITIDDRIWDREPNGEVIEAIADLINVNYPQIKRSGIIGHSEANPKTSCPGEPFIKQWKSKITNLMIAD